MRHLLDIVDQLRQKMASLRVLGMNLDTDTATGRMMLQALGAVVEHERASMPERQREGIAKAKAEGKYKGRAPTAMTKAGEVEKLLAAGVNPTDVALQARDRKVKRVPGDEGTEDQTGRWHRSRLGNRSATMVASNESITLTVL